MKHKSLAGRVLAIWRVEGKECQTTFAGSVNPTSLSTREGTLIRPLKRQEYAMTLSRTTRDHDEIRKWAEARGAVPAEVKGTERGGSGHYSFRISQRPPPQRQQTRGDLLGGVLRKVRPKRFGTGVPGEDGRGGTKQLQQTRSSQRRRTFVAGEQDARKFERQIAQRQKAQGGIMINPDR